MTLILWLLNRFLASEDDDHLDDESQLREQHAEELRILKRKLVEYETEVLV